MGALLLDALIAVALVVGCAGAAIAAVAIVAASVAQATRGLGLAMQPRARPGPT